MLLELLVILIVAIEVAALLARLRRRRGLRPSERIDGLHKAIYGRARGQP